MMTNTLWLLNESNIDRFCYQVTIHLTISIKFGIKYCDLKLISYLILPKTKDLDQEPAKS